MTTAPHSSDHANISPLDNLHELADHEVINFFPGQRAGERMALCLRQHWLMKIAIVARAFVLSAIPIVALIIITSVETMDTSTLAWLHVMLITYLLFVWLYTYIDFLRHELSVLIVTNERVIEIVQKSLFTYQLAEANLDRIQDVIGFTHGVFGMFFDLGRVEIQTAGTEAFVCRMVAAPHLTARKILNVQRQHLMHSQGTERRGHGSDVRKRSGEALSDEEILRMRGRRDNDELRETHQPTDV